MPEGLDCLGTWRRSHYSIELSPNLEGKVVTVFGSVASVRKQGGIIFMILQDRDGIVQVTAHRNNVPQLLVERLSDVRQNCYVGVKGLVKSTARAPNGAEIVPKEIKILARPSRQPPFDFFGRQVPRLEKRLDLRAVDLRRAHTKAIFKIRHTALESIRTFLSRNGFVEVNTPKIIASATEGGAALFPLLYYDKEAFLAQSPQLYKEQLVGAFERVFEIAPIFRAEESRTLRHLSESTSVDVEEAYVTYEDVMVLLEKMVYKVVKSVSERCVDELKILGHRLKVPKLPFGRYTYNEFIQTLNDYGVKIAWGNDVSSMALREHMRLRSDFYFITKWPTTLKAFYIKPQDDNPELCEGFDFMHRSVEIASGGSRISSKQLLIERLKEQNIDPKLFEYHLKVFDYGMPPHAGFGLGLDRLMMVLTGQRNIREVVLFPRDRSRLTP